MSAIYDREKEKLYVSVSDISSFLFRCGSIDPHARPGGNMGGFVGSYRMVESKPQIIDEYSYTTIVNGVHLCIYTYPEYIRYDGQKHYILISKHVDFPLDFLDNGQLEVDTKSAMLSAYILSELFGQTEVFVSLNYYCDSGNERERTRELENTFTRQDLAIFFDSVADSFSEYAQIIKERATNTVDELSSLRFPFEVRDSQREMITESFRAITHHKRLVAEAPTGTGKTLASLYPALKSISTGHCDKIFYLTGKTTTANSAINAINLLRNQLPHIRAIHISAKDKCCVTYRFGQVKHCDPKHCKRTKNYFGKINDAIIELLKNYKTYTSDIIDEIAAKYSICAYELTLELSEWCEVIICDYNYLFDVQAYLRRYFDLVYAKYIFLIDEAHNLPDRAREMYSVTLKSSDFKSLFERYNGVSQLDKPLSEILRVFNHYKCLALEEKQEMGGDVCGFYKNNRFPSDISDPIKEFVLGANKILKTEIEDDELNSISKDARKLISVLDIYDDNFTTYCEVINDDVTLRILCLDPSPMLDLCMKKGVCSIIFSATLTPLEYFSDVLGCEKTDTLSLKTPFEQDNLCLIGVPNVSTRYADREKSAQTVANIIRAMIAGKIGNYIVYFPSYKYLSDVFTIFTEKYPKINVTCQSKSMSEKAKKDFLDSFENKPEGTLVGFCVMGGSFSEGIDLRGERLIGAMIVGVGLPTISNELNIIKEHFDITRESGYDYTYTYPGMIKVTQAAGRVIRSHDERGVVLLVDDRFATEQYKELMPSFWSHIKYLSSAKDLLKEITDFWKK